MCNSNIRKMSRPIKSGETLQEGDLFWTMENDNIIWLEISEDYVNKKYDAALFVPMRRPITQAMEFICSKEKQQGTYRNT